MHNTLVTTILMFQLGVPVLAKGDPTLAPSSIILAHGVLAGALFVILFPLGAILLRLSHSPNVVRYHGAWQTACYIISLASLGLGAWLAHKTDLWNASNGHPIIGTVVIGLLLFQPFGGMLHHHLYKRRAYLKGSTTQIGIIHRWAGRILLLVGAINGGLGAMLAKEDSKFIIPYSVLVAIMYLTWAFVVFRYNQERATNVASRTAI